MLFRNYQTIQYTIGNKTVSLVDIFRNITFTNTETSLAYDDYYLDDGETPEDVSVRLYGTTSYSWLVLMVNNIAHIKEDWYISTEEFKKQQEIDFGGDALYIPALPDLQPGDILVKVTATAADNLTAQAIDTQNYRHISNFDPYFRKIRAISGTGGISAGDYILFARQNTANGTVNPITFLNQEETPKLTDFTNVLYKESYGNSVDFFYNSSNVVIDAYRTSPSGTTSINANTLYTNSADTTTENNFASSIIYKYGVSGGSQYLTDNNFYKKTISELEFDKYIKKQKIRVLRKDYLTPVLLAVENALQSDTIGKKLRIEI